MPLALWILAIGPNITVIHNIIHTWQQTEHGRQSLKTPRRALGISPAQLQTNLRAAPNPPRVMTRSVGRGA